MRKMFTPLAGVLALGMLAAGCCSSPPRGADAPIPPSSVSNLQPDQPQSTRPNGGAFLQYDRVNAKVAP